jgi:predicted CoA-binding protein
MTQQDCTSDDVDRALIDTRTIAMVGASPDPARPSYGVMRYLQKVGYRVIPVNPTAVRHSIHGERVYSSLATVPERFEMVNVFRRSSEVRGIVEEILPLIADKGIRYLWLQLQICDAASAERARHAGIQVIMDRCVKTEHRRLVTSRQGLET